VVCDIINRSWRYRAITAQQKKRNKFFSRVRRAKERVIDTLKCRTDPQTRFLIAVAKAAAESRTR
jgi:hypothetical protein